MVIESKEEVFDWFKNLSGAQRVEMMYGLFNMSIPLEWRLFATVLENLARRDFLVLKEDEFKSNTAKEIETVCSLPWLDTTPVCKISVSPCQSSETSTVPIVNGVSSTATSPNISPRESRSASPAASSSSSANDKLSPGSVRSKVVIYLCLLNSTNRICASVLYNAMKTQLSPTNVRKHVEKLTQLKESTVVHNNNVNSSLRDVSPSSAITPSSRTSSSETVNSAQTSITQTRQPMNVFAIDQHFVAEITLMYTLAIHHPAFSFEMQQRLTRSLSKVRLYLDGLVSSATLAPLSLSTRSNLSSSSLITGVNFQAASVPKTSVNISQLATLKQQVGQMSPTIRVTTKLENLSVQTTATDSNIGRKQLNVTNRVSPAPGQEHSCSECSMDCPTYATSNICQKNSSISVNQNRLGSSDSVLIPSPLIPNVQTISGLNNQVNGTTLLQTANVSKSRLSLDSSSEISNVVGHCPSCNCSCSTNMSAPNSLTTSPSSTPPPLTPTSVSSSSAQLPQSHNPNMNSVDNHYPCWFMFPPNTMNPSPEWLQQYYQNWTFALSHSNNVQYWPQFHLPLMANNATPNASFAYNSVAEAFNTERQKSLHKSCYNCGEIGHRGDECVKETLDDVTRASKCSRVILSITYTNAVFRYIQPRFHACTATNAVGCSYYSYKP